MDRLPTRAEPGAPPPYTLVIFDFDGTLADSWRLMGEAIVAAAEQFGYRRLTADQAHELRGEDSRAVMAALGVTMWQLPRIVVHMRRVARAQADRITLFEGVDALLRDLDAAGVSMAIVSSNAEDVVRRVLGPDLCGLVEHFACGAALFGKAAKFRRVVGRSGVAPGRAIGVGDEGRDIDAATAAGIASAAVTWGYATRASLERHSPIHVVTSVGELSALLTQRPLPPLG